MAWFWVPVGRISGQVAQIALELTIATHTSFESVVLPLSLPTAEVTGLFPESPFRVPSLCVKQCSITLMDISMIGLVSYGKLGHRAFKQLAEVTWLVSGKAGIQVQTALQPGLCGVRINVA